MMRKPLKQHPPPTTDLEMEVFSTLAVSFKTPFLIEQEKEVSSCLLLSFYLFIFNFSK
eukprot:m.16863 g.16863  ORF g.16863 m.16863 type:complete len:58 (+) comp8064_c0_seq1:1039-1212(+)